jgi:chemotaxis protein CheC
VGKILVIDDSRLARVALRQILERAGHEVVAAENAIKGLELIQKQPFDCITSDILMPGMDGRELLDVMRARRIETPIVVVTADIQETTRAECMKRGAYAVVDKPLKGDGLLKAVEAAVSGGRATRRHEILSAEQLDALAEFVNVGVGRAAAALNELVASHVELSAPQVDVVPLGELHHELGGIEQEEVSSVQMSFRGSLDGCAFLVFPPASALKLVTLLTGDESRPDDLDSILSGTLTEVGNILINSIVGTLSNVLRRPLHYSLPVYAEEPLVGLLAAQQHDENALILLAKTNFVIRQMQIEGNLLLLFELMSFDTLLSALKSDWGEQRTAQ